MRAVIPGFWAHWAASTGSFLSEKPAALCGTEVLNPSLPLKPEQVITQKGRNCVLVPLLSIVCSRSACGFLRCNVKHMKTLRKRALSRASLLGKSIPQLTLYFLEE